MGSFEWKRKISFSHFRLFYEFYLCYKIACKLQVIIFKSTISMLNVHIFELVFFSPIAQCICIIHCAIGSHAKTIKRINIMLRWRINLCRLVQFPYILSTDTLKVCNLHFHVGQLCAHCNAYASATAKLVWLSDKWIVVCYIHRAYIWVYGFFFATLCSQPDCVCYK